MQQRRRIEGGCAPVPDSHGGRPGPDCGDGGADGNGCGDEPDPGKQGASDGHAHAVRGCQWNAYAER